MRRDYLTETQKINMQDIIAPYEGDLLECKHAFYYIQNDDYDALIKLAPWSKGVSYQNAYGLVTILPISEFTPSIEVPFVELLADFQKAINAAKAQGYSYDDLVKGLNDFEGKTQF